MNVLTAVGKPARAAENLWSVILAGGDGERTRPFIERWLGYHKPKQYCSFVGHRSLFQHTVDRADAIAAPERRVVIAARKHRRYVQDQALGRERGHWIFQPANRGTAPGILLALTRIRSVDPDATVVIYPSDHFVYPEEKLGSSVREAAAAAGEWDGRIILFGVTPDGAEREYGWILPGSALGGDGTPKTVTAFIEKPSAEASRQLLASGGLWNSMILVGRLRTFWDLCEQSIPEVMPLFQRLQETMGGREERSELARIYRRMPQRDFSRDVLQRFPERLATMPLDDVLWSDWGRPQRIVETLERIGATPAFPFECAKASPPLVEALEPSR